MKDELLDEHFSILDIAESFHQPWQYSECDTLFSLNSLLTQKHLQFKRI